MNKITPLADNFVKIVESPSPQDIYCYSPGIAVLPGGRLLSTMDFGGPGVIDMPGARPNALYPQLYNLGRVSISDDSGKTWRRVHDHPLCHARPFVVKNSVYILGHSGDLGILRSDDRGESWSEVSWLTDGESWHQAPSNVWYRNGAVYLVMERITEQNCDWPVNAIAPVLMRGGLEDDLLKRENWTFASELICNQVLPERELNGIGAQFYDASLENNRFAQPLGWLEAQVIQFQDPDDVWTDPAGHTFHLFLRTNTGLANVAAMLRVEEKEDGSMITCLEKAPSGKTITLVYLPGGHMKFHMLYDEITNYYWLLSTQCTDGLKTFRSMPDGRGDPVNERHRLMLHFSKNCFDWCFAGMVCMGPDEFKSRHYAAMAVRGEDLLIVSRSGDEHAKSNHDTNFISFHVVQDFRDLIY